MGKSTVSLALACSLSALGMKVGLLDADLQGPSLPTMIGDVDRRVQRTPDGRGAVPAEQFGLRLMSYGFLSPTRHEAAVMRGPLASQVVQQMALGTAWGDLDYLVVDLPPGTGDIHLALMQATSLTANIVVTTPQVLAHVDARKGLAMFDALAVPTVGAVNNMAYFVCGHCQARHDVFGGGAQHAARLDRYGIPLTVDIPIVPDIAAGADQGTPFALSSDASTKAVRDDLMQFCRDVHERVEARLLDGDAKPAVTIDGQGDVRVDGSVIRAGDLRRRCRCALCLHEMTGERIGPAAPDDVRAVGTVEMGNYAVAVHWSDGHRSSIYTYDVLRSATLDR